ncbi:MAG: hypothetical protein L0287_19760 [Anaerolineae bacterium]|nr:hypothetical protein [Anaerolineae bacterium]MCI0611051.1 hypothetical protein [Anaerolineae bacterium]
MKSSIVIMFILLECLSFEISYRRDIAAGSTERLPFMNSTWLRCNIGTDSIACTDQLALTLLSVEETVTTHLSIPFSGDD